MQLGQRLNNGIQALTVNQYDIAEISINKKLFWQSNNIFLTDMTKHDKGNSQNLVHL